MGILSDPVMLARIQFALTVIYHFVFVPLSVGLGLVMAVAETRHYRTRDPHDRAASRFWLKIFTVTFTVGVATGITMEFSFGTNWADYSRFVGDIFGAPLAAEALFAFFLESVFLGVMLFGRKKVSPRFYMVSTWLVWLGSMLSALWIIIANSWMQTPAGYEVVQTQAGAKAVLTDFAAAALNPSLLTVERCVIFAVLIAGAFVALSVSAWYLLKKRDLHFAKSTMTSATIMALVATVILLPTAHSQAVVVAENQPLKLAAMEGQYETEPAALYLFGYVDTKNERVVGLGIPGGTSFLASGNFDKEYPGLYDAAAAEGVDVDELPPTGLVFQTYHGMVMLCGAIVLVLIAALWVTFARIRKCPEGEAPSINKWVLRLLIISPLFPMLAIQLGWLTAEFGRQPWVVQGLLRTDEAISGAVSAGELLFTIVCFVVIYLIIFVAWITIVSRIIKRGPVISRAEGEPKPEEVPSMFSDAGSEARCVCAAEPSEARPGRPNTGEEA